MRPTLIVLIVALGGLSGCVEFQGAAGGGAAVTIAEQCQRRAVRLLRAGRDEVTVAQALSYPEGDIVTLDVAGQGRIRCQADVDGVIGDLLWISGGPGGVPPEPPPQAG